MQAFSAKNIKNLSKRMIFSLNIRISLKTLHFAVYSSNYARFLCKRFILLRFSSFSRLFTANPINRNENE